MSNMSLGETLGRRTEAGTREPGDLPRRNNVNGRGVLVCGSDGRFAAWLAMRSPTRAPNLRGILCLWSKFQSAPSECHRPIVGACRAPAMSGQGLAVPMPRPPT